MSIYSLWPRPCSSLSSPTLSLEFGQVLRSALSVSAQIKCHIISVSSLVTQFVYFDPKTFVFLGYILEENGPSFVLNNNFVYGQMFRRVVKF